MSRSWRRVTQAEGSASLEVAVLGVGLVLIVVTAIALGRLGLAQLSLSSAANHAVRSASAAPTEKLSNTRFRQSIWRNVSGQGLNCVQQEARVDTTGFARGVGEEAMVKADVSCTIRLADSVLPGLPGEVTVTSQAESPIDRYVAR